ncbi:MAG: RNA methyltransferase [Bdellovibrionaceae bacterium]|nr:RNA methyltransferase [Pseudobdellovibrionaceae bacterium]
MRSFEIRIVLVRTLYERNIGATSRSMSNMGASKLILLSPQCELTYESQKAAATGQTGLQNRTVYQSWAEFLQKEPESIKIAFTARDGRGRQVRDIEEILSDIKNHSPQLRHQSEVPYTIHLIFGPEDWGLSAEDLEVTNFCACLPTYGENSSLNLAQATLLAMYSLRKEWGGERTPLDGHQEVRSPQGVDGIDPDKTLKTWLMEMGFDLSKKRINVYTVLRRMLLQNTPTKKELIILETVLQQSIRKLREYNEFRKTKN